MNTISIVIVTKNRSDNLNECINSLLSQSRKIDELVIVDNNSTDNTKKLIKSISKTNKINIKYVCEKKIGYPSVRNRGLKEARGNWVAFIDDDCIADRDWYKEMNISVKKYPKVVAILGESETYYKDNVISLVSLIVDRHWKLNGLDKNRVINYEILDSKNIIYNKTWLLNNKINFNEKLTNCNNGACEDIDLGLSIYLKDGLAIFSKKIKISHKDPRNLVHFLQKYFFARKAYLMNIEMRIKLLHKFDFYKKRRVRLFEVFKEVTVDINLFKKVIILLLFSMKVLLDFLPIYKKKDY